VFNKINNLIKFYQFQINKKELFIFSSNKFLNIFACLFFRNYKYIFQINIQRIL